MISIVSTAIANLANCPTLLVRIAIESVKVIFLHAIDTVSGHRITKVATFERKSCLAFQNVCTKHRYIGASWTQPIFC